MQSKEIIKLLIKPGIMVFHKRPDIAMGFETQEVKGRLIWDLKKINVDVDVVIDGNKVYI